MPVLFIGKFQPFHKGHLAAIKWILKREYKIFIIIGSTQKSSAKNSIFSFKERKEMIKKTLFKEKIKNFKIFGVPDFSNDVAWAKAVLKITKLKLKEAIVFTKNSWTKKCFKKFGMKVKPHPLFFNKLSATQIREKVRQSLRWENLVPKEVFNYLKEINGIERIKYAH